MTREIKNPLFMRVRRAGEEGFEPPHKSRQAPLKCGFAGIFSNVYSIKSTTYYSGIIRVYIQSMTRSMSRNLLQKCKKKEASEEALKEKNK